MWNLGDNSRSAVNRRDRKSRDSAPPLRFQNNVSTARACISTEPSAKMALTCKVQYLDDTDPFASTNFPEPTRPPTYTFHLNITLCQQIAGLHRLLCAPHNVCTMMLYIFRSKIEEWFWYLSGWCVFIDCGNLLAQIDDVALQLSHNGCYLDLESSLEEQADLLEGFLDRYVLLEILISA